LIPPHSPTAPAKTKYLRLIGVILSGIALFPARPVRGQSQFADTPAPLTDFAAGQTYLGFEGGLYPGGANVPPEDHARAGYAALQNIAPRAADGTPAPDGKIVLLSIGMSNTEQEFCGQRRVGTDCEPWTFSGQAQADPAVNHETLVIVDGAAGGHVAAAWTAPEKDGYANIRTASLAPLGLTPAQVQVVWLKLADSGPKRSLPDPEADAHTLAFNTAKVVRSLKFNYPNLQMVFISSRIYGGYATTPLNPEPYAYESGFAMKWLIETQISQRRGGEITREWGDLTEGAAPWLAWGPYLWANGAAPRADGLVWLPEDFADDGTHPSTSGEEKVGRLLLEFFSNSDYTRCWFLAGGDCASMGEIWSPGALIPGNLARPMLICSIRPRAGRCPD
jgi:hypothetical protein